MSDKREAAGRTLRCTECGAAVPIRTLSEKARCPFCGMAQPLDGDLRGEIERYRAQVQRREAQLERDLEEVARLRVYRDEEPGQPAEGLLSRGRQALWCPNCGAKCTLEAGQVVAHCGHCEGSLLPTSEAMEGGMEQSRARWCEAQRRRIREERRSTLWRQSYSYFFGERGCLLFFVGAGFVSLGLLALFGMFQADARTLTVAAATAVAVALSIPVVARYRRGRGGRWQQIQGLVARHGGRRLGTFREVLAWLNVRWASYYSPFFLARSALTDYAALTYAGVPVMINVHLEAHDLLDTARLHLLLAAPLEAIRDEAPEQVSWTEEARQAGARLRELGFFTEIWASGVSIQATPESIARFREQGIEPERLEGALEQGQLLVEALRTA